MTTNLKNICVVLIIDTSGSMSSYEYDITTKRATQGFLDILRPGDQFAVVNFDTKAYTTYSNGGTLATVDQNRTQIEEAKKAVDNLRFNGSSTNMEAGVELAKKLASNIEYSPQTGFITHHFLLITDGYENRGSVKTVLPDFTPIYTCAMGPRSDINLLKYIAQETKGEYYYCPTPFNVRAIYIDMLQQYNHIEVVINETTTIAKADYYHTPWYYTNNNLTFVVFWDDPNLKYVDNVYNPKSDEIGIALIAQPFDDEPLKPLVIEEGYVIFQVDYTSVKLYCVEIINGSRTKSVDVTVGILEYIEDASKAIRLNVNALNKDSKDASNSLAYNVSATQGDQPIKDLQIQASVQQLVYSGPYQPNKELSDDDILRVRKYAITHQLSNKDRSFVGKLKDGKGVGYSLVQVQVSGESPESGKPFQRTKLVTL